MVAGSAGGASRCVAADGECDRDRKVRPQPAARVLSCADLQAANRRDLRSRSRLSRPDCRLRCPGYDLPSGRAGVAHLVERDLAKVEVAGSKPVSRSTFDLRVVLITLTSRIAL